MTAERSSRSLETPAAPPDRDVGDEEKPTRPQRLRRGGQAATPAQKRSASHASPRRRAPTNARPRAAPPRPSPGTARSDVDPGMALAGIRRQPPALDEAHRVDAGLSAERLAPPRAARSRRNRRVERGQPAPAGGRANLGEAAGIVLEAGGWVKSSVVMMRAGFAGNDKTMANSRAERRCRFDNILWVGGF